MEQATVLPTDVLLVSFDLIHGEGNRLCIVGRKNGKMLEIVNAFEGQKAEDIFRLLTTVDTKRESHGVDQIDRAGMTEMKEGE